jgi:alpha-galactosidase
MGGFDSEIGWPQYLDEKNTRLQNYFRLVRDNSIVLQKELPLKRSGEQHIPIIDAMENDHQCLLELNIPNKGLISGVADDVVVEVPALVSSRGVQGIQVGELPKKLMLHVINPRINKMEQILYAYTHRDNGSLVLSLLEDNRSRGFEQARALIDELLSQPWNKEAQEYYR